MSARLIAVLACLGACGRTGFDSRDDARDAALAADTIDAAALPTLLQAAGNAGAPLASLTATLPATPQAGHVLVLVGGAHVGSLTSVTGAAPSWTRATFSTRYPNIEILYGIADGTSGTVTIQASAVTGMTLWIGEWSRLDSTALIDTTSAQNGVTSPATAGSITTAGGRELVLFGVNAYVPNTYGTPTGAAWTLIDSHTGDSMQSIWSVVVDGPATIAPTVDLTDPPWDAALAAFRTLP